MSDIPLTLVRELREKIDKINAPLKSKVAILVATDILEEQILNESPTAIEAFKSIKRRLANLEAYQPTPNPVKDPKIPEHLLVKAPFIDREEIIYTSPLIEDIIEKGNEMKAWILKAAPMLSDAACIVIDEAPQRLGEIEGVRALLENCPINYEEFATDKNQEQ